MTVFEFIGIKKELIATLEGENDDTSPEKPFSY